MEGKEEEKKRRKEEGNQRSRAVHEAKAKDSPKWEKKRRGKEGRESKTSMWMA